MNHDERYGPSEHLVDYILGITHQIWERAGMERIRDYYDQLALLAQILDRRD